MRYSQKNEHQTRDNLGNSTQKELELAKKKIDELNKQLAQVKKENELRKRYLKVIGNHKFKYGLKGLLSEQARECEAKIKEGL